MDGFEDRYEVSNLGRVKSLPFQQRYLLRNGQEAFRRTRERVIAQRSQNSGYLLAHLHRDNQRIAVLVHRLVALAFVPNPDGLPEVNHEDGVKTNCHAGNLSWVTRRGNHLHAVATGLNTQAVAFTDPATGVRYPSITQAARAMRCAHRTVRKTFERCT